MKRKGTLFFVLMLFTLLICSSCTRTVAEDSGDDKEVPIEQETDNEKPEDENENKNPDGEEENLGEGSLDSEEEEDSGTDKGEGDLVEVEPEVITDEATIMGLATDILSYMTLEEKIGQLFIVNLELLDDRKGSYYEFRKITKEMKKNLELYPVGGIIFFARNIETREQTVKFIEKLQDSSKIPLFTAVDEEGGEVARIADNDNMKTTTFPAMEEIGTSKDTEYVYDMGCTIGAEMKELGFNLNFAPVADVKTNADNREIGNRSFGSDPKLVAKMVKAMTEGLQEQGVSSTLKHFPGQGDAGGDTHKGAVNLDNDIARLRKIDFVPFKSGIKAGADFIMVSHISISQIAENTTPASLSELVMKDMLRNELSFKGIIITDAFDMKPITEENSPDNAAVKAIAAGADVVLMPENLQAAYEGVCKAVTEGELTEAQIDKSVQRILETKIRRGLIFIDTTLILDETSEDEIIENIE